MLWNNYTMAKGSVQRRENCECYVWPGLSGARYQRKVSFITLACSSTTFLRADASRIFLRGPSWMRMPFRSSSEQSIRASRSKCSRVNTGHSPTGRSMPRKNPSVRSPLPHSDRSPLHSKEALNPRPNPPDLHPHSQTTLDGWGTRVLLYCCWGGLQGPWPFPWRSSCEHHFPETGSFENRLAMTGSLVVRISLARRHHHPAFHPARWRRQQTRLLLEAAILFDKNDIAVPCPTHCLFVFLPKFALEVPLIVDGVDPLMSGGYEFGELFTVHAAQGTRAGKGTSFRDRTVAVHLVHLSLMFLLDTFAQFHSALCIFGGLFL